MLNSDARHAAQHFGAVHGGDVRVVDAREESCPLQERPGARIRRRIRPEGEKLDRPIEAQVSGQHAHDILAGRADDLLQPIVPPERAAQPLEPVAVGHGGQFASDVRSESATLAADGSAPAQSSSTRRPSAQA